MMAIALAALLGAMTWTLMEYGIHRFLGHGRIASRNFFGVEHIEHHRLGNYFAAAWKKLAAALVFLLLVAGPLVWMVGMRLGLSYAVGLIGAYLIYEWIHWSAHAFAPRGPYGRWVRRHHFFHHFHDPSKNHGVTSPIWDLLFATRERPSQIAVPDRIKMPWLCDPSNGEVWPRWRTDFRLRRRADKVDS